MRLKLKQAVLLIWCLGVVCQAGAQDSGPNLVPIPPPMPPGLETVEFFSAAVNRSMKFDIVLPAAYEENDQRYPVLYLLHGYMQNYTVWGRSLSAAYYSRYLNDLILVLPDAGNSWYVNYAGTEDGQLNNWEDYIIEDLVAYVDANFRTVGSREGRAISGLSMGGYGAITMGLRHPQTFVSIGSTSGALGYARSAAAAIERGIDRSPQPRSAVQQAQIDRADAFISELIAIPGFSTQDERTPKGQDFLTTSQALAYDPFSIIYDVPKSELPHIYLDSGTDDGLITVAREFMQTLLINNVAFDFMQSRGRHNSEYWRRSIGHMMTIQYEVMQRALGNRP